MSLQADKEKDEQVKLREKMGECCVELSVSVS